MNRRGISYKFISLSLVTSVAMLATIIASAHLFIVIGFSKNQIENSIDNNKRAYAAISEYTEQITSKAKDWANWDDSYYFAEDGSQNFIDVNMDDTSFDALDVHLIRFTNKANEIVYQKSHIRDNPEDEQILSKLSVIKEGYSGIARVDDLIVVFSSLPILKSDGTGPASGTITFARVFDKAFVDKISKLVRKDVEVVPFSENLKVEYEKTYGGKFDSDIYLAKPKETGNISSAISIVSDYDNKPTVFLKVSQTNTIYQRGITSFIYFVVAVFGLTTLSGVLGYVFISKSIIRRVQKLNEGVIKIGEDKNFDIKMDEEGDDEIASLGMELNSTMTTLKSLDKELIEASNKMKENYEKIEIKNKELEQIKNATINILEDEKELEDALRKEKEQVESKVQERTKELQVATDQVTAERAKLLASINSLSIGFVVFNVQNEVVMANNSVNKITGLSIATWTTKDLQTFFGDTVNLNEQLDKAERTDIEDIEVNVGEKFFKLNFNHIDDPKIPDAILGVILTIGDITESRVLDRAKDEFFSIASHELRTPLTAIRGNTSLIKEHYQNVLKDKDLAMMIDDMHEASVRLIKIVNDFLDSSRLQQKRIEFKKDKVEVIKIAEDTVQELQNNATEKGITLSVEKGAETSLNVTGDAERIKQVLVNLVGNSIKFTSKGGVTISFAKEPGILKILVTDTGSGIPKDNQNLLFRKFQQAGDKILTRDATQGTGMGLYISRMLMEGMNGKVELVSSEEGKGTVFAMSLPLA